MFVKLPLYDFEQGATGFRTLVVFPRLKAAIEHYMDASRIYADALDQLINNFGDKAVNEQFDKAAEIMHEAERELEVVQVMTDPLRKLVESWRADFLLNAAQKQ